MEQRITLITLGVSDVKRSRQFYDQCFGWTAADTSNDDIVFYDLGGMQLALFKDDALAEDAGVAPGGSGFRKYSIAHNTRSEREVDELVARLASRGATVVKAPQKVFWGGYSAYIADPDGILWEIAYNPYLLP